MASMTQINALAWSRRRRCPMDALPRGHGIYGEGWHLWRRASQGYRLLFATLLQRRRDRPAGTDADQMRTVFSAAMDIARHAVGRDGQAFQRFWRKTLLECF